MNFDMDIQERITQLSLLGEALVSQMNGCGSEDFAATVRRAEIQNPWFTRDSILSAFGGICKMLRKDTLAEWAGRYPELGTLRSDKTLGAVLAGNLPMVGFHDMLCAMLCGLRFRGKLSSKDKLLLPYIVRLLGEISPAMAERVDLTEGFLTDFQLVVATGSDNSSRYFDFYFSKFPHIIRHSRSSVAVLTGDESAEDMLGLADDVFLYFGLGCRSVSKIYFPKGFRPDPFYEAAEKYSFVLHHNKYFNNYEYRRALLLLNILPHFDNGFCLLVPQTAFGAPIGEVYYEEYSDIQTVADELSLQRENMQCIVSQADVFYMKNTLLGTAQFPEVDDYADGVDTVQFLIKNA